MRRKELGIVIDTIYEEEIECSNSSSSSSLSSPPTPHHPTVQSWSLATGHKADVLIYVEGKCFHLHKEVLTTKSTYFKRQLAELSEITLPLNITAETFTLIANFCYGTHIALTPFNVVALRTAAELLGVTETKGKAEENLKQITETYFRRVLSANQELKQIVFRSCLRLLPEAETMVFLLSRCVEALDWTGDDEEMDKIVDDVLDLDAEEFEMVADAMHCRFISHDVLYRIVDLYIQQHSGKITEEQKMEICNFVDCEKLSPHLLLHAVQNPRLPLRFIVRAMLIEQLNTRRAIVTASTSDHHKVAPKEPTTITLGSILQRDAAARQSAKLKAEMDSTSSRIQCLEKELAEMKKFLKKSETKRILMEKKLFPWGKEDRIMREERCVSFHYGSREEGKVEKGERGSSSFAGVRLAMPVVKTDSPRVRKSMGMGLIHRLKSTLWVSKSASKSQSKPSIATKDNGALFTDEFEKISVAKDNAP